MGLIKKIKSMLGNTLYYPGCLTKFALPETAENYRKIMKKIGIDFIELKELEFCCGSPVLNAGYKEEAKKLAEKNFKLFKEYGVSKIITSCPACYKFLSKDYKEFLENWDIEIEFILIPLLKYMQKNRIDSSNKERATYHDPCHLGRHSGIYEEPREILSRAGYEIIEMQNNKNNSLCCGGGGGLKTNNAKLSNEIAKKRIMQAKKIGVKKIITPCPLCFANMQENSDIEVEELSYSIGKSLGIETAKNTNFSKKIKNSCA
jgi:Fe-S oxidoreductase